MAKPLHHRNDCKRRARHVLVWCAAVLCISPLLGGWLVDHLPFHIRDPDAAATVSLWAKAKAHSFVLLLGSSRMGSFVRTVELAALTRELVGTDSVHILNAALVAGDPITVELLTRRLLALKREPPRLVLLETGPDLLARDNAYFKFVITRELTAGDLPKYIPDIFLSHKGISRLLASRLSPFFLHRSQLLAWAGEMGAHRSPDSEQPAGDDESPSAQAISFQFVRDKENKDSAVVAERMRIGARGYQSHLQHYQLAGATPAAFEETVAMLHAHGCAIVLVQPPMSSAQRALFTTKMHESFNTFVSRLQTFYACQFFDYSERLPDTDFVDNDHANNPGSVKFTELLAKEVVAPAWRNLMQKAEE